MKISDPQHVTTVISCVPPFCQAGVWPKMANYFLLDLMRTCNGGSVRAQRKHQQSMSSTPVGYVSWRQGLDILREAKSVGVKLSPEVMVVLLSRIPPGNSRKVIG